MKRQSFKGFAKMTANSFLSVRNKISNMNNSPVQPEQPHLYLSLRKQLYYAVLLFSFISGLNFNANGQIITTYAGNGTSGYSGNGGPATSANMWPMGIACSATKNVITEYNNARLRSISPSNIISAFAGTGTFSFSGDGGQATAATMSVVFDVVMDASGNVYFADPNNYRIRKISTGGIITTYAGTGTCGYTGNGGQATAAQMCAPHGLAINASGDLFVAEPNNHVVRKITSGGIITLVAGNNSAGFSGNGGQATAAQLNGPVDVAVDASGNVYISDQQNNRIRKVTTGGIISTHTGTGTAAYGGDGGPATAASINTPYGLAIDACNNLFIADNQNSRIRKVNSGGIISTYAGNGSAGYAGDGGAATAAMIHQPHFMTFDASGNLYFADVNNYVIRKVAPATIITGPTTVCIGGTITLTASVPGGTWSSSAPAIATIISTTTTTATIKGLSAGSATISYLEPGGCYVYFTVTVTAGPTVTATPVLSTICRGSCTSITATGATTYTWAPGATLSATTGATVTACPTVTTIYTVIGTSPGGCTGTGTVTIAVNPIPTITVTPAAPVICRGSCTALTSSGAATYTWSPGTGLSATTGATVTACPTVTTTYTVTGISGGCSGTRTVTVTVNPIPTITATPVSSTICRGSCTSITASGAATYTWSPGTGLSSTTGATVTACPTVTTTYTITGTSALGCVGTSTVTITVNPVPTVTATPVSSTICAGSCTSITASGAATYTWSPGTGLSATTGTTVTACPTVTTTYTVTGTSAGCTSTSTVTITVNPIPAITVTPVSSTICAGSCTSITSSGAATYTWSPGTGLSATTGATVTACPTVTTTYTVTGTSAGCTGTNTVTITVNPIPVITVTPVLSTICAGSCTSITSSGAATYTWSPGTGLSATTGATVTACPTVTTTYTVTGTSAGCTGTNTVTITVNPVPAITVTPVASAICAGSCTSITTSGAATYTWAPPAGLSATTGATVTACPAVTTTYTVTGTSGTGCVGTGTVTITVNPTPTITVTPAAATICAGSSTGLTASGAITYSWLPVAGLSAATGASVTASPATTTTYTVTGTDAFGCTSSTTVTVTVNPAPVITVTPVSSSICAGATTSITASGAVTYVWSPATDLSASTGATVIFSGTTTTTYTVTGTDAAGCTGTGTVTITVDPIPTISVTPVASTICAGSCTSITASGAATYTWAPPTGLSATTGATVTACPAVTITYTVTGTSGAGCVGTGTVTITVNPTPTITVTPAAATICAGSSTGLTASGAVTYSWLPVAGLSAATGASVTASPATTTTYTVTGTDAFGCTSSTTVTITVNPAPVITVIPVSSSICAGATTSITASGAVTYVWSPATDLSASTGATVIFSGTATTTYTVTGTDAAGCTGTGTVTITVDPIPTITVTPVASTICAGSCTSITASGAATYTWAPPTGLSATTGATVTACPAVTITYTITGTSGAGCVGTGTVTITVNPTPTITVTPAAATICAGSSTGLTASGAVTYSWLPVAGLSAATGASVTASPATTTTYTVTGTDAFGCTSSTTVTITVNPAPVITVTPASSPICVGTTTSITASGAVTYVWSPATDLSASTGATVIFSGTTTTTYTVTGTDAAGCTGTGTVTITVDPVPSITVTPVASTICVGSCTSITASGAATYTWAPPTGLSATTGATVTACPTVTTTYTVTGTTGAGCVGTGTVTIVVNPIPTITVTPPTATICAGSSVSLTASGAVTYVWTPVAGLSSATGATVVASPPATITYTVVGTDASGCSSFATVTITVNPSPGPIIINAAGFTDHIDICVGNTMNLYDAVPGGTWTSSAPGIASVTLTTGILYGVSPGTATITYTLPGGCYVTIPVTVWPVPTSITGGTVCVGSTITLTGSPAGGTWYTSGSGISTIDPTTGDLTGLSGGTETVTYSFGPLSAGCYITASITVCDTPRPRVQKLPKQMCVGDIITVAGTPGLTGFASVSWSTSNPAVVSVSMLTSGGTVSTAKVWALSVGTADITYSVTNACGCTGRFIQTVTVYPMPAAITGPTIVCEGSMITLADATPGGTWATSNPAIASVDPSTGDVYGMSGGTVTIYYGSGPCMATYTVTVIGRAVACAHFGFDPVCGCWAAIIAGTAGATITYHVEDCSHTFISGGYTAPANTVIPYSSLPGGTCFLCVDDVSLSGCTWSGCGCPSGCCAPVQGPRFANTNGNTMDNNGAIELTNLAIIPNPNSGMFTLTGSLSDPDGTAEIKLEIVDVLGKVLYVTDTKAENGNLKTMIMLGENVANGVYFLRIRNNESTKVMRFTLDR